MNNIIIHVPGFYSGIPKRLMGPFLQCSRYTDLTRMICFEAQYNCICTQQHYTLPMVHSYTAYISKLSLSRSIAPYINVPILVDPNVTHIFASGNTFSPNHRSFQVDIRTSCGVNVASAVRKTQFYRYIRVSLSPPGRSRLGAPRALRSISVPSNHGTIVPEICMVLFVPTARTKDGRRLCH